jgi:hypothetical protein
MEVIFPAWITGDVPVLVFYFFSKDGRINCQLFAHHRSSYRAISVAQLLAAVNKTTIGRYYGTGGVGVGGPYLLYVLSMYVRISLRLLP